MILVDEHPQSLKQMSLDAPYFYGAAIPAAVLNENATAQVVLESNPRIFECVEAGVDVRVGTIAWGAFRNAANSTHIGTPKLGLVSPDSNELLEHDVLVFATGARDVVPSFAGWNLPGVFGVKAGLALLDLYQCYEGRRTLVLGTSPEAVRFVRSALAAGVEIVGMVEPSQHFAAGQAAADEMMRARVPVHYGRIIAAAEGATAVNGARLTPASGAGVPDTVACDTICIAIGSLPNIELPAAMGCDLMFDASVGSWLPTTSDSRMTTLQDIYWLSRFCGGEDQVQAVLAGIRGDKGLASVPAKGTGQGDYLRLWIDTLFRTGGGSVMLCQCEEVTREAFLGLAPPRYLGGQLRHPQSPVTGNGNAPRIQQDQMKRMTRVGMGHCQGKRCRDEAALLLSTRFGIGLESITPGSYRFPVRPIDLDLIAAGDETPEMRENWLYWPAAPENP